MWNPHHDQKDRVHNEDIPEDKNLWLFNVAEDPEERQDLSDDHPDIVNTMLQRLAEYKASAMPYETLENDFRANPDLHGGTWLPWDD